MDWILHTARRVTRRSTARSAATAAVLLPALLTGTSAVAAEEEPRPPKRMSTVGGERLGLPGTQVEPKPGAKAPALPKKLTARAWIVADAETGDVLAAHNAHWPLAPASTLKMLFADTLIGKPGFEAATSYTVRPEDLAELGAGSSAVGVKEDHAYTVHDLWNGVFLASGNDAVHTLAAMNGGLEKTVREMNERAAELGAKDTHVVSPDGYDADGQTSSAYDLTLIARSGMQKPDFRAYAATTTAKFPGAFEDEGEKKDGEKREDQDDDGGNGEDGEQSGTADRPKRTYYQIQTTNRLLRGAGSLEPYEGLAGVKNGYTTNAGYTFTGVAERGDRTLLVTVMHPDHRKEGRNRVYEETALLFDWGFDAADAVEPVGELVPPLSARQPAADGLEPAGHGEPTDPATAGDGSAAGHSSASGLGTALGLVGATGSVLAVTVWLVHRRWPTQGAGQGPRL
ncbi:D-alanyl-D-alanine carboxypeptidase family protein [Streptomyces sp. WMMC1477]|uniref:D-alanyl-D-alanine carboxypeptidase family protein n=1 Tax=Streptomyces sp. WMMC1477 TaxID=3015155 RepID=UPI003FCEB2C9